MSSYPSTNVICIVASQSHGDQQWRFVMNIKLYPSAAPLRHRGLFTLCASFILVALLVSACGGSNSIRGGSATAGSPPTATQLYVVPKFSGIPPGNTSAQGRHQCPRHFGNSPNVSVRAPSPATWC